MNWIDEAFEQNLWTIMANTLNPEGTTMQHDFILLDRSGSMESLWVEALGSVNAYVTKLAEDKVDTGVNHLPSLLK